MELLGILVRRNFGSLGGGSTRKEGLWREYIYPNCLNGVCGMGLVLLRNPRGRSGGWQVACRATQQMV
jgi:hypothetical protein